MKVKFLLTALLVLLIGLGRSPAFAENPCNVMIPHEGDGQWGMGAYLMPDNYSIDVYDDRTGEFFGKLTAQRSFLKLIDKTGKLHNVNHYDLAYIGNYQNELLKTKKCFNPDFVRILWKTSDRELYISKEDATREGAQFLTYLEAIHKFTSDTTDPAIIYKLGVNLAKSCLNLRADPSISGRKILCAMGNDWHKKYETLIKLVRIKGDWAHVVYSELHPAKDYPTNDEDCYSVVKNKQTGWLKLVDEKGFPNVWFAVSSY